MSTDENIQSLTFKEVKIRWPWRPIPNCPGRYVLPPKATPPSFQSLLGNACTPQTFRSSYAKDPVLICLLPDGGIISYQQSNGTFIHTLNTTEGFQRKIHQLGLTLESLHIK